MKNWYAESYEEAHDERITSGYAIASRVYNAPLDDSLHEQFPYRQIIRGDGLCYLNCCLVDILQRCVNDKAKWDRFKENISTQYGETDIINHIEILASNDENFGLLDRAKLYDNVLSVKDDDNLCTQLVQFILTNLHPKLITSYQEEIDENDKKIALMSSQLDFLEEGSSEKKDLIALILNIKNVSLSNTDEITLLTDAITRKTFLGDYEEKKLSIYVELLTQGLARNNQSSLSTYSYDSENEEFPFNDQDNPDFIFTYNPGGHFDLMFNKLHPVCYELNPEMALEVEAEYQNVLLEKEREQLENNHLKSKKEKWQKFMATINDAKRTIIADLLIEIGSTTINSVTREQSPQLERVIDEVKADIEKEKLELDQLKALINGNEELLNEIKEIYRDFDPSSINETDENRDIFNDIKIIAERFKSKESDNQGTVETNLFEQPQMEESNNFRTELIPSKKILKFLITEKDTNEEGKFHYNKILNAAEIARLNDNEYDSGEFSKINEQEKIIKMLIEAKKATLCKYNTQNLDNNFFVAVMKVASENSGLARIEEAKFNTCFDKALKDIGSNLEATKYTQQEVNPLHKIAKYFSAQFQELSKRQNYLTARPGVPEDTINKVGRRLFRVCTEKNIKKFQLEIEHPPQSPSPTANTTPRGILKNSSHLKGSPKISYI